jgi:type I restriction enzyme S subunit
MTRKGWEKLKLGDLGKIVTGKTPPTKKTELYGEVYPFITPTDIVAGKPYVETDRYLSEEGFVSQKNLLLPAGSVCFTSIASIGKMCITTRESFTNQQINSIIVHEDRYDPWFIYYALQHETPRIKNLAGGVASPIINKSVFSDIEIEIPSLPTQREIALALSAYDNLIENNTRRMKILEEMAQAIYREWFVEFRAPGVELRKATAGEQKLTGKDKFPDSWEVKRTSELVKRLKAGTVYTEKDVEVSGSVPVVDQSKDEFLGYHNNQADHEASTQNAKIIFGDHTCRMRLMVEPFSVGPNVVPFVSLDQTSPIFLFFVVKGLVKTQEYKRHWTDFMSKLAVKPSIGVANQFAETVAPSFQIMEVLSKKNANLRRTRDLLLPKLISGEVEVENVETGS